MYNQQSQGKGVHRRAGRQLIRCRHRISLDSIVHAFRRGESPQSHQEAAATPGSLWHSSSPGSARRNNARSQRQEAHGTGESPLVCGPAKHAGLFWFTISPLFTDPAPAAASTPPARTLPRYLERPGIGLDRVWALPDRSLHALGDAENSSMPTGAR
jgi:hypothetical protein